MKNLIKTNREMVASEYFNNHIDDSTIYDEVCFINNHWEDFLEGDELINVKETEEWLGEYESENAGEYVAPSIINMYIDEDGDIWVGGNESWASQCFDADVPMGDIIDYLVEELMDEYKKVNNWEKQHQAEKESFEEHLKELEKEGFSPEKGRCNISDYTNDWKEYLQMNDEDPEEYTLEEYAIDNGFVYYNN